MIDFNAIYLSKNISNMNMKIKSYILTFTLFLCGCVVTANAQNNMTVTDCQGHTYPVVKIGWQYWMAENLQCTKYDTQSERAGVVLSNSSSDKSYQYSLAPFYTDGRNDTLSYCSQSLTSTQRKKLGVLYNWAAAVGIATEEEARNRIDPFSVKRQGICPNGWHIPTIAEWVVLSATLDGGSNAGKLLKATSGWYENGNGTNDYSFAALPAGFAVGSLVLGVGCYSVFVTATPYDSYNSYRSTLSFKSDSLRGGVFEKYYALSVRCVKNYNEPQAQYERKTVTNTITDCQGHTYPVVKIGNQYWMAENLQCTKYDTQSERAGATLSTSNSSTDAPYYTDGRNTTTKYSGNLTSNQRKKLGLLYNWAAAVGLATESEAKSRTTAFSGRRQGICPNGWHIPTDAEWVALGNALGGTEEKNGNIPKVGKKLKATSGWHGGGNGTNDYSFAALPAGGALRSSVDGVGAIVEFWTATPRDVGLAYLRYLGCDDIYRYVGCNDDDLSSCSVSKRCARSVRCIRN